MGRYASKRRAAGATAVAAVLFILFDCAPGTGDAGESWSGEDSNRIFHVLELRPDGEFVATGTGGRSAHGTWRLVRGDFAGY